MNTWPTLVAIFGIIAIFAVGVGLFIRAFSKNRWLKQHGTRIIATVTDSVFFLGMGAGQSKVIVAEWTDPRIETTYQFRGLVPSTLRVKLGESVDVLIDADNPKRYTITSVESISRKMR
ncbi:MAG TPA: hypothetical protein VIY29_04830 [Ktedonobacteraceae bacterium]